MITVYTGEWEVGRIYQTAAAPIIALVLVNDRQRPDDARAGAQVAMSARSDYPTPPRLTLCMMPEQSRRRVRVSWFAKPLALRRRVPSPLRRKGTFVGVVSDPKN